MARGSKPLPRVGILCVNPGITGRCRTCLWWEWDSARQGCFNQATPWCPKDGRVSGGVAL